MLSFSYFVAMKKFCSTCSNQLELSQRFCGQCGVVNPFFVPAFTLLSDQSQSLEKLREEKERIERELAAKEDTQKEFQQQELLRQQIEALNREKTERLEKEIAEREKAEREKSEANIKKEILQVKEEAEQYKRETIDLVREVRNEVKQEILEIGEENKRLKHEVENLSKQIPEKSEPVVFVAPVVSAFELDEQPEPLQPTTDAPKKNNRALKAVLGIVLLMGAGLVFFYYNNINNKQTAVSETAKTETANTPTESSTPVQQIVDTILESDAPAEKKEVVVAEPMKVNNAVLITATKPATIKKATATEPIAEKPRTNIAITEAKVTIDLNGKKISGCGVVIGSDAELKNVSNLVLVERTTAYNKYKCMLKLKQGSDNYTAVPYLYYTDDGAIIKIDGTNCE